MINNHNNNTFFGNKNTFGVIGSENTAENSQYLENNIPLGLSMAFGQNAAAMTAFANMSMEKKKKIIERASRVSSKKEMTELVQNISMNNLPD